MTRLIHNSNICLLFLILISIRIAKTSHVLRQQTETTSRTVDQQNGQPIQSQSLSSKPIYDTLASIDERIRLLEAYDNTYKLTRLDFTLEQLSQRIGSIESKLSRIENVFDSKATKIEEMVVQRERKEEFKTESFARKIDNLSDRLESKSTQIEAKFEPKIDKIVDKLETIERYLHLNNEEVLEKFIKYDERHTVFESHVKSHIINIENLVKHSLDANTNIKEIVSYDFEAVDKVVNTVKECNNQQNSVINRLTALANQIQNSSAILPKQGNGYEEQRHKTCDNCGQTISANGMSTPTDPLNRLNKNGRTIDEPKSIINSDIYDNISSTLEQLRQLGVDEKLTQLDVHIDYFSRKIINTIQEIWRSSQSSEAYLRQALDMANKTRSFIKLEFRRLQELIDPLTKTPDLSDISEPLEQKLYQLSTTIDDSFNALLISQNSFISSCNRIQEEEEQLYEVLDDMLIEIRNKSSLDVSAINAAINGVTVLLNQSMLRLQTQIESIDRKIINEIKLIENKYLSSGSVNTQNSQCFLTRNQLISVCNKNENNINNRNVNQNNEQMDGENSEEKIETNYEDLTQT